MLSVRVKLSTDLATELFRSRAVNAIIGYALVPKIRAINFSPYSFILHEQLRPGGGDTLY